MIPYFLKYVKNGRGLPDRLLIFLYTSECIEFRKLCAYKSPVHIHENWSSVLQNNVCLYIQCITDSCESSDKNKIYENACALETPAVVFLQSHLIARSYCII